MRYSPLIVEHFTNPRNVGELEAPDVRAFVGNPVCGDQILLTARISDGAVVEARFLAHGCAASLATASILTSAIVGERVSSVAELTRADVVDRVGGLGPPQLHCADLGLAVLQRLVANIESGVNDENPAVCT